MMKKIFKTRLVKNIIGEIQYKLIHPIEKGESVNNLNWEPILGNELMKEFISLESGFKFLDIGAAFGVFSLLPNMIDKQARVLAIEPYWLRRSVLKINTSLNSRVKVLNYFISNKSDKYIITLEDLCLKYNFIPDVIKMDIEGGEFEAILGSLKFFKKYKPTIFFEFHKGIMERENKDHKLIISELKKIGYTLYSLDHHSDEMSNNFLYKCKID